MSPIADLAKVSESSFVARLKTNQGVELSSVAGTIGSLIVCVAERVIMDDGPLCQYVASVTVDGDNPTVLPRPLNATAELHEGADATSIDVTVDQGGFLAAGIVTRTGGGRHGAGGQLVGGLKDGWAALPARDYLAFLDAIGSAQLPELPQGTYLMPTHISLRVDSALVSDHVRPTYRTLLVDDHYATFSILIASRRGQVVASGTVMATVLMLDDSGDGPARM